MTPESQITIARPWSRSRRLLCCAGLLLLDLFFSFYKIKELPLVDPDEPRYAAAGRSMAEGGSWLVPHFNGEPRLNKPPLFYWLVALSDRAFGEATEVSARFPSVVMGLLMIALTVWLGTRLFDDATGFLAGLILCTAPLYLGISRACITDQTFSTLLCMAISCFLLGLTGAWPFPSFHSVLAAGILAGLAFLTKGTAAMIVLVVPFLFVLLFYRKELLSGVGFSWVKIWLAIGVAGGLYGLMLHSVGGGDPDAPLWSRAPSWSLGAFVMAILCVIYYGLWTYMRSAPWVMAMFCFFLLGGWWYVLLLAMGIFDPSKTFSTEIMGRLSGKMHSESIFYYSYVFPAVFLPWSLGIFAAIGSVWKRFHGSLPLPRSSSECSSEVLPSLKNRVVDAFLLTWMLGVVLFFSIPGAKLGTYVLPALSPAALLTARLLRRLSGHGEPVPAALKLLTLAFSIFLGELLVVIAWAPHEERRGIPQKELAWSGGEVALILVMTMGLACCAYLAARALLRISQSGKMGTAWDWVKGIIMPFLAGLAVGAISIPSRLIEMPNRWQDVIDRSPAPLWLASLLLFLLVCVPWIMASLTRHAVKMAFGLAGFIFLAVLVLFPYVLPGLQRRSNKTLLRELPAGVLDVDRLYSVGCEEESLSYYLHRTVKEMRRPRRDQGERHQDVLREALEMAPPGGVLLFIHHRYYTKWLKHTVPDGVSMIHEGDHIVVLINKESGSLK